MGGAATGTQGANLSVFCWRLCFVPLLLLLFLKRDLRTGAASGWRVVVRSGPVRSLTVAVLMGGAAIEDATC